MLLPNETLTIFFFSALLLSLSPGPDNIFVLTQSIRLGARAGLAITLGLCTGLLVHTMIVAFGVAAMIQTQPLLLWAIKGVGRLASQGEYCG